MKGFVYGTMGSGWRVLSLLGAMAVGHYAWPQEAPTLRGPSFVPDAKVEGASLSGWQKLGGAEWSSSNGEIVGKGTNGDGWLVLDR